MAKRIYYDLAVGLLDCDHVLVGFRVCAIFLPVHPFEEWLEHVLTLPEFAEQVLMDRRFVLTLLVAKKMNACMRRLYRCGAWLRSKEAAAIAADGLTACRAYRAVAEECLDRGEPRFPVHRKFHMLVRTFRDMKLNSQRLEWQESPMGDSCQMDEGFVGQLSRYSRRVSPKSTIHRMLDVYLTSLWALWRHDDWP